MSFSISSSCYYYWNSLCRFIFSSINLYVDSKFSHLFFLRICNTPGVKRSWEYGRLKCSGKSNLHTILPKYLMWPMFAPQLEKESSNPRPVGGGGTEQQLMLLQKQTVVACIFSIFFYAFIIAMHPLINISLSLK